MGEPIEGEVVITGEPTPARWPRQTRNIIGVGLAFMFIIGGVIGVRSARKPDLEVNCSDLRETEMATSQDFVVGALQIDIARLEGGSKAAEAATDTAEEALAGAEQRVTAAEEAVALAESAEAAAAEAAAAADPADSDLAEDARDDATQAAEDARVEASEAAAAKLEMEALLATTQAAETRLNDQIATKKAARKQAEDADPGNLSGSELVLTPARSDLTFVPDVAVAKIHFGSTRNAKRVEIALVAQNETQDATDGAAASVESSPTLLPDTFWFRAETDQLRRNSGLEIPADEVTTWARRFGDQIFLSVCIEPSSALDAGKYVGSAFVADPAVRPISVPIEVTAQTSLISWILLALLISPVLAFLFVWVKFRHSANSDPTLFSDPFWRWAKANFILAYVLGFAAVWATLQVPLSNETFGDSVVKSAAAVGVTLVAAVGAITPVVGRVRGEEIDLPPGVDVLAVDPSGDLTQPTDSQPPDAPSPGSHDASTESPLPADAPPTDSSAADAPSPED